MSGLPEGVVVTPHTPHADARGVFVEAFRESWPTGVRPVQWNVVHSRAGVLRGVHVHRNHTDYLTVASGTLVLGLADLRGGRRSAAVCLTLDAATPCGVTIPPGVAHGFYFPEDAVHVYAVDAYFNPADELGCRWDDPLLGIPWPQTAVTLSARDAALPDLDELLPVVASWAE